MIDEAKDSGHEITIIPERLKCKIQNSTDFSGAPVVDMGQFVSNYNDSFDFSFIEPDQLSEGEQRIYNLTQKIIEIFGGQPERVKAIKISSTMREDFSGRATLGCWDGQTNTIVLARKTLRTIADYSGTLIHELIHAETGHEDVTRAFERSLTDTIGKLCEKILAS